MITYVNSVLVSNLASGAMLSSLPATGKSVSDAGKFVVVDADTNTVITSAADAAVKRIKIGVVNPDGAIKWSNVINQHDVKSNVFASYAADSEDAVTVDFTGCSLIGDGKILSTAGKRVIVRITYKDTPTRFRKWTESYEYITSDSETAATMASGIASLISSSKNAKRARVTADGTTTSGKLVLTAMKYDDDDSVDSINVYNKVRFDVNVYYTNPEATGFASHNKYFPIGTVITKEPGVTYQASAKLVRDMEAQAMGYQGILNRGECTWPIIKPAMVTDLSKNYDTITLEFENMYRAADDIFRKTKQAVNIYGITEQLGDLKDIIDAFVSGEALNAANTANTAISGESSYTNDNSIDERLTALESADTLQTAEPQQPQVAESQQPYEVEEPMRY